MKQRRYWLEPHPSPEEFWAEATKEHKFRVNCTEHAEFKKFRVWFLAQVEKARTSPKSYHQEAIEKFGPVETYIDYSKEYKIDTDYPTLRHSRKEFNDEKWKPKSEFDVKQPTGKKLDDKHKIVDVV